MRLDFASPDALWADFVLRAGILTGGAMLVSLAVWVAGRRSQPPWTAVESLLVGGLLLLGGLWLFKAQTLDRFWRIDASASELRVYLRRGEPLVWPVSAIADVLYGFHAKTLHGPCRLVVETRDGERLLSADQRLSLADCRALRAQVLTAMGR